MELTVKHSRRRVVRAAVPLLLGAAFGSIVSACGATAPTEPPSSPLPGGATPVVTRQRVPPGQQVSNRMPILDLGTRPDVDLSEWSLEVAGEVDNPVTLSWVDFQNLPHVERTWDFHCVTGWSKLDARWAGVLLSDIIDLVQPKDGVVAVIFAGRDRYTTNVRYDEVVAQEAMIADQLEGTALALEHGGPARGVVPWLYAWKSAKFVSGISFANADEPGYWETRGYNNHADPWKEERFS
jgi:DMSO/TMAO reductase YedYZ molybdopterin-dependent catalytic subunit